jgi:hypothetical protein
MGFFYVLFYLYKVKNKCYYIINAVVIVMLPVLSYAQCAMCTKTAAQLGEKPALGLNNGILYLMLAPFAVVGVIAFRWWKANKDL